MSRFGKYVANSLVEYSRGPEAGHTEQRRTGLYQGLILVSELARAQGLRPNWPLRQEMKVLYSRIAASPGPARHVAKWRRCTRWPWPPFLFLSCGSPAVSPTVQGAPHRTPACARKKASISSLLEMPGSPEPRGRAWKGGMTRVTIRIYFHVLLRHEPFDHTRY